ncbi:thyrotropin-releasing hormone receptor-like, partial [Cimex lectularius]|uniref:Thyrotropin-releasing hormone receptor n=1 Tax=Cimex lectularius TaxID=79782 RepID=A0A8I6SIK3_CIMLE
MNLSDSNFSDCESDLSDPDFFSYRYRAIGTFFQGIIFVVGVLGNAMVVLVVSRVRALHSPTNCYLVSLAIADSVVLVASVPNEILSYYLVGNQWVWGDVGCSLFIFCQNLGINASSLSLVAFTVERYIAICHPMTAHKMCTTGRAKKITLAVWLTATVYCSPWLALTVTRPLKYRGYPDARECVFRWPRNQYLIVFFTDLVMFYVIPLVLSCILYCLISLTIVNRKVVSAEGNKRPKMLLDSTNTHSKTK